MNILNLVLKVASKSPSFQRAVIEELRLAAKKKPKLNPPTSGKLSSRIKSFMDKVKGMKKDTPTPELVALGDDHARLIDSLQQFIADAYYETDPKKKATKVKDCKRFIKQSEDLTDLLDKQLGYEASAKVSKRSNFSRKPNILTDEEYESIFE